MGLVSKFAGCVKRGMSFLAGKMIIPASKKSKSFLFSAKNCLLSHPAPTQRFETAANDIDEASLPDGTGVHEPKRGEGRNPNSSEYNDWIRQEVAPAAKENPILGLVIEPIDRGDISIEFEGDAPGKIKDIAFLNTGNVNITNARIEEINVYSDCGKVGLYNCRIDRLYIKVPSRRSAQTTSLVLTQCNVNNLSIEARSLFDLIVYQSNIEIVSVPAPHHGNPFGGSVSLLESHISAKKTEPSMFSYLRRHLEQLDHTPNISMVRALELESERRFERGVSRFLSNWYSFFAAQGMQPGRPLCWALALAVVTGIVLVFYDGGGSMGYSRPEDTTFPGFHEILSESPELRTVFLVLQAPLQPLGLFSAFKVVVANTTLGAFMLAVLGLMGDALIITTVVSLRRRFRMPG